MPCLTLARVFVLAAAALAAQASSAPETSLPPPLRMAQAGVLHFDPAAASALRGAQRFDAWRIPVAGAENMALSELAAEPSSPVDEAQRVAAIKAILLAPSTYVSPDIQRACPAWPSHALRFRDAGGAGWFLLISQLCESVRYVREDGNWRSAQVLSLDRRVYPQLMALLP